MNIGQLIAERGKPFYSFEFFPPKDPDQWPDFFKMAERLAPLEPLFTSVTYGAGGSRQDATLEIVSHLKKEFQFETMAHLTCVGATQDYITQYLQRLRDNGVDNVLALRGDRTPTRPESPDFKHASDLTAFIKWKKPGFSVHGACYPEAHPEAATLQQDVENLRIKQANGAEHLLTQLFFDNMHFYRFLNLTRRAGVTLPVSAGVMPIVKRSQIERTVALSSASLPSEFTRMVSRFQDDPDSLYEAGIEYAVNQLRDLIEGGADGVHLYAMNDANVAAKVYEGIKDLL